MCLRAPVEDHRAMQMAELDWGRAAFYESKHEMNCLRAENEQLQAEIARLCAKQPLSSDSDEE